MSLPCTVAGSVFHFCYNIQKTKVLNTQIIFLTQIVTNYTRWKSTKPPRFSYWKQWFIHILKKIIIIYTWAQIVFGWIREGAKMCSSKFTHYLHCSEFISPSQLCVVIVWIAWVWQTHIYVSHESFWFIVDCNTS